MWYAAVDLNWHLARWYAWLYGRVKDATGANLRGLGWLQWRVRREHVFQLAGQQMLFEPSVAGCYGRLLAGEFNELATYEFLLRAIDAAPADVTFLEVGANVGEFLIPIAAQPRVRRAIGYEPQLACAAVCARSAQLNHLPNVEIRTSLVGNGSVQLFLIDEKNPNASAIGSGEPMHTVCIDDDVPDLAAPLVMLIDVEGAEPLVLEGARETVARLLPLIVFEYNYVSRRHYQIQDISALLGSRYKIFRLRGDGTLDMQLEQSWNCVAIPANTSFEVLCA